MRYRQDRHDPVDRQMDLREVDRFPYLKRFAPKFTNNNQHLGSSYNPFKTLSPKITRHGFAPKFYMSSANAKTRTSELLKGPESRRETAELVSDSIAAGVAFAIVLTVGQRVVGFGRGILFCRLMTDQQLGQWSMVWSYLMLLAPLAVLGLPGCFGKFTEYFRQRGQLNTFVGRIAGISFITTALMSAAIVFNSERFSYLLFRDSTQTGLTICLGLALLLVSASNFLGSLMESLRQIRAVTIMRFITGISFAIVATLFLLTWEDSSTAATTGFAISCAIGSIPAIWILWKYREDLAGTKNRLSHSAMWKRIAPFAVWLWVSNLLNNLIEVSDRYMLIHWSSTTADLAQGAVGQYHSGRVVPLLLVSIAIVLSGALLPYMSQAWEERDKSRARNLINLAIKLTSVLFTLCGVLILLLSPILFETILQGRYTDGLAVLPITLVYCIWFSLMVIAQDYLWVAEKGKWASLGLGVGLVLNVIFNMILIPHYGLFGAVTATAVGNAAIVLIIFGANYRFGCKPDLGIWACTVIPLLLLLGKPAAIICILALLVITAKTNLILNKAEKSILFDQIRERLGNRFSGSK